MIRSYYSAGAVRSVDNRDLTVMSDYQADQIAALRAERERLLAELLQAQAVIQSQDRQIIEMDATIRELRFGGGAA